MESRDVLALPLKTTLSRRSLLIAAFAATGLCPWLHAESFVLNPSFEVNFNVTWPHYGGIDSWELAGGSGVNEGGGPFHNTGTAVPDRDRIGFKQGSGTLSQAIVGLSPGKRYWIQFYYDARTCCAGKISSILVKWNDTPIDNIQNVVPAMDDPRSYYFRSVPFVPESETGKLTLETVVDGDATANFDAVTIVQRDEGNVILQNPSFEASGPPTIDFGNPPAPHSGELFSENPDIPPANLAGWAATGQYGISLTDGIYADNGAIPDQDLVGFLEGPGSLSQTISDLVVGTKYDLSFAYNARTGARAHLQVKIGDTVLFEEDVDSVGGRNPYRTKTVSFNAADTTAAITFAQTSEGNATLLLDDVRLVGQIIQELPPLKFDPGILELGPTQRGTIQVTVPAELLATQAVDLMLGLDRPEAATLVNADPTTGVLALHFDRGGNNVKSFEVEGVATGTARLSVLNLTDLPGLKSPQNVSVDVVSSFVRNASFEGSPVPGGVGYGPILGWTGGSGLNADGGPFADNGIIPDRSQVAFLQGATTLSQEILNLTAGGNYWLQFRYNARASGATTIDLSVKFDGGEIRKIEDIAAVEAEPYHFVNIEFAPPRTSGLLEFSTSTDPGVDATLLLDAVNIVQRDPGDVVIQNPSFEASGNPVGVGYLGPIAGWSGGSGINIGIQPFGPFTDNGVSPDQDRILFIQGSSSIRQLIEGLTPGREYSLTYSVNRRNCCGASTLTYSVSIGDEVLVIDEEVLPVGGDNPYEAKQVSFVATGNEGELMFSTVAGGDASFLIDDVRLTPVGKPETWVRGDTNGDRKVDISDVVGSLGYQFLGDQPPECLASLEFNIDGALDLTDPVGILSILFLGAPSPPTFQKCEVFAGCRPNCP